MATQPYFLDGYTDTTATDLLQSQSLGAGGTQGTLPIVVTLKGHTIVPITPDGAATFNVSGGFIGAKLTFWITTSGTSAFTLTFGTNCKSTATLSTGTADAKQFTVSFINVDGTKWVETSRTAAM